MTTLLTPPDVVDDVRRRDFLGILAAAGLLAGCGGEEGTTTPAEETRRVVDELGVTVEVPTAPRTIAVIDNLRTAALLVDLGVTGFLLAENSALPPERMPDELRAAVEEAGRLGEEYDLEVLATQAPDVILYNDEFGLDILDGLRRVAPTIAFRVADSLEAHLQRLAGWFGRESQAEEVLTRWRDRLAETAELPGLAGRSLSIVLAYPDASAFNLYGSQSDLGAIVGELGGEVVPAEVDGEPLTEFVGDLSLEVLPSLIEADTVLLLRYTGVEGSDEAITELQANAVWRPTAELIRLDVR